MSIFDVVVNTDDLVVLGPPDVIDLAISIGEQGNRGATFFAGSGNPNDAVISQNIFGDTVVPVAGDMFINTATGPEYGWIYIYNPKIVGDQWDQVLRLQPPIFSSAYEETFTAGTSTISVPLASILPNGVTQSNPDNYIVTITPIGSDPTVLTINSKAISGSNLDIVLEGIRYSGGTWSALSGAVDFCMNISVV